MKKTIFIIAIISNIAIFSQNTNKQYSESVRNNASTFHKNFSTGEFEKNGDLVNEKIYVNSNNIILVGKNNFVERIKRFHTPFPNLKLMDKIIIVDENKVGLLYVMQGTQDGPYGTIKPSGNKINVYAAEFFTMDDNAKMKELLTITQLDQLKNQITGKDIIVEYDKIHLLPIKSTSVESKKRLKNKLDNYVQNFNTRDWDSLEKMFSTNANILINGKKLNSKYELIEELKKISLIVPDITYHLTRNIVEGDRGAISYDVNGSYEKRIDGQQIKSDLKNIKQGAHFQFDDNAKIVEAIIIFNAEDLMY